MRPAGRREYPLLSLADLLAGLAVLTRELLLVAAVAVAVSSLDDLAMDALGLWARLTRRPPPPQPEHAPRIALLVPAWREEAVIAAMLARTAATLQGDWRVFVGAYPNDPQTRAAALSVADSRITVVVGPRPGPTTKADCLNSLWAAARAAGPFDAVLLQDAEDLVHHAGITAAAPWLAGHALVQLPVLPLPDRSSRWIGGHYLDEFAEAHAKDMPARDRLGAAVPSAGVATLIRWDWLERLADGAPGPFDPTSLTEDYEIGHRIAALGGRSAFARVRVDGALVATREYFPATLGAAVRQKSRWLTGIALTGWDRLGWRGRPVEKWLLLRDRKGLFTAAITPLAYLAGGLLLVGEVARAAVGARIGSALPSVIEPGGWLHFLMLFNAAMLAWRLMLRAAFVTRAAGPVEGLRSVPRAVVGNAVNALAALRAVRLYRAALAEGRQPAWEKTDHRFPGAA
jgi:adsorption protein B